MMRLIFEQLKDWFKDDSKNTDITEEDDENVNIFQLLLTLFMTFTL